MVKLKHVTAAINQLQKYETEKTSTDLLDNTSSVNLVVGLNNIIHRRLHPYIIPLPHSFRTQSRVCLFCKDTAEYQDFYKGLDPRIEKVLPISEVRSMYKTYEQRRALQSEYDRFLCDESVFGVLTKLLGKTFLRTNAWPLLLDYHQRMRRDLAKSSKEPLMEPIYTLEVDPALLSKLVLSQ
ncbi:hypothetical protein GEMRC1_001991 [Eukaryota sp. GEM-RC1]